MIGGDVISLHLQLTTMPRLYQHIEVNQLPVNAVKVSQYAKDRGVSYTYIYELSRKVREGLISEQDAGFQLITFQSINFIIPLT